MNVGDLNLVENKQLNTIRNDATFCRQKYYLKSGNLDFRSNTDLN